MPGKYCAIFSKGERYNKRFNEAPAICRGNPLNDVEISFRSISFNEAPAICRGNQGSILSGIYVTSLASMRPRQYAGEIVLIFVWLWTRVLASMRPRQYAGEISGTEWQRNPAPLQGGLRAVRSCGRSVPHTFRVPASERVG